MNNIPKDLATPLEPALLQTPSLPEAEPELLRAVFGIGLLCIVLLAVCWATIAQILFDRRESDLQLARATASNLAIAFEESAYRTIRQIDQSAMMLAESFAEHPERFTDEVRQLVNHLREDIVFQVALIAPDGYLIYSNLQSSDERVYLGDREHVRVQIESPDNHLFISKPLLGRISRKWSIQFSRKVLDRSGSLIGVIVLSVEPNYFTKLYHRIDIGQGGVITLVGLDRIVRARYPETANGRAIVNTEAPYRSFYERANERTGTYDVDGGLDGIHRLAAYRKLDHFPLAVIVLLSIDEALARYRELQEVLIAAALMTSFGIIAAGVQIGRGAIRKARHYRQLHHAHRLLISKSQALVHAATTDPLCDIHNRRSFLEMAEREFERAGRYGRPLSVILFDVDHFKLVNDRFGHASGDRVLQSVTASCVRQLRSSDRIGRLGGEEFAVILPETDRDGALAVAERMRSALDLQTIEVAGTALSVTASFGVAVRDDGDRSLDAVLQRADVASYQAKTAGRNRVCLYEEAAEVVAAMEPMEAVQSGQ